NISNLTAKSPLFFPATNLFAETRLTTWNLACQLAGLCPILFYTDNYKIFSAENAISLSLFTPAQEVDQKSKDRTPS
ncbi:MAG: hypothetical protein KKC77_15770, partial [Proteobacteria bacterium]|nr:hypothetical protein [Pseudomonadota bacterium]